MHSWDDKDKMDEKMKDAMQRQILGQMLRLDDMGKNINEVFTILKEELGRAENEDYRIRILELMVRFVRLDKS